MSDSITLPSYLTVEQADLIASQLYGLMAYVGATPTLKLQALTAASQRVDASRGWQGTRVDELQPLEFPRCDGRTLIVVYSTGAPAVPMNVKLTTVFEANSLIKGQRQAIAEARAAGLQSQQIGSAIEMYVPAANGRGAPLLCVDADNRVKPYVLRSGRIT